MFVSLGIVEDEAHGVALAAVNAGGRGGQTTDQKIVECRARVDATPSH